MSRLILLNPGPVTLTDRVRGAVTRADWCHREPEFGELTVANNARLVAVYEDAGAQYVAVTLTGSGTAAVEAMLAAFAPSNSKTLVLANGVYGERMAAMLAAAGRPVSTLAAGWKDPIDLDQVERRLQTENDISHIATVQHETTTGRLNPIAEIGALCQRYGRKLLLDAVSSFGAEQIQFEQWNLQALAATSNKCLHGIPGISFVIAEESALKADGPPNVSVYLDLRRYYATQSQDGYSPFTQAVQSAFALDAALDELAESGGWRQRQARYRMVGDSVRETLAACGVRTLISPDSYSSVLCSYRLPGEVTYGAVHDALKNDGFVIYAGQGQFAGEVFRIAHMGDIRDDDLERLGAALTAIFGGSR